jgi:hypothetical protein
LSKVVSSISKVVFSVPGSSDAFRGSNSVAGSGDPFVSSSFTSSLVVLRGKARASCGGVGELAIVLGFHVLRFLLVSVAVRFRVGQNGNISPGGRMPVRIIVTLFSAFKSVSISIVVLSSEDGGSSSLVKSSFFFSVGNPKSHISLSGLASKVIVSVFVHSISVFVVSVLLSNSFSSVGNSVSGSSVSNIIFRLGIRRSTHVLQDYIAIQSRGSTTVLASPFDGQERAFIKIHCGSEAITSLGIILGIE